MQNNNIKNFTRQVKQIDKVIDALQRTEYPWINITRGKHEKNGWFILISYTNDVTIDTENKSPEKLKQDIHYALLQNGYPKDKLNAMDLVAEHECYKRIFLTRHDANAIINIVRSAASESVVEHDEIDYIVKAINLYKEQYQFKLERAEEGKPLNEKKRIQKKKKKLNKKMPWATGKKSGRELPEKMYDLKGKDDKNGNE